MPPGPLSLTQFEETGKVWPPHACGDPVQPSMPIDFQPIQQSAPQSAAQPAHLAGAATPSFDEAYARARALANGGQPELALAAYTALLARSPGNADVLLGRGIVHARLARWREAEADLGAAAAAAPDYADVWMALGDMYAWRGEPARAALAYSRAIALQPGNSDALRARARAADALARASNPPQNRAANPDAAIAAGYGWQAGAGAGWTGSGSGAPWRDQTFTLRHYGKQGSIALEALRAQRFGLHDRAWALDAYANLWQGAYANLRYQRAPGAALFPANAGRAEIYQSLGHGWEASVSGDVLGFGSRVNLYGIALGKYIGNFYLQLRHQAVVSRGAHGKGERLLGRWYYSDDSYFEGSVNGGRSEDAQSLLGGRSHSGGGNVVWTHYWNRDWGTRVQASFARANHGTNAAGNAGGSERGLAFSVYRRW
jgi:YaiO family outer membrane protein